MLYGPKVYGANHFLILMGLFLLDYLQRREISKTYILAPQSGFRDSVSLLGVAQWSSGAFVCWFLKVALLEIGEDWLVGNLMQMLLSGFQAGAIYFP